MPPYDRARPSEPGYWIEGRASHQAGRGPSGRPDPRAVPPQTPTTESCSPLLQDRWRRRPPPIGPNEANLEQEIADGPVADPERQAQGRGHFARAQAGLFKSQQTGNPDLAGVEEFLRNVAQGPERALAALHRPTFVQDEKARRRSRTGSSRNIPTPRSAAHPCGEAAEAADRQALRAGVHRRHLGVERLDEGV